MPRELLTARVPAAGRAARQRTLGVALMAATVATACSGPSAQAPAAPPEPATATVPAVAHESARYAPLDEITPANVGALQPAWTYHSGDFAGGQGPTPRGTVAGVQVQPVIVGDLAIVTTPSSLVIALDGETGEERWRHDPQPDVPRRCYAPHRGVAVWSPTPDAPTSARTVFSGTCDGRLLALDAATGVPRAAFGEAGALALRPGVDARDGEEYTMTSPPAVYRDLVITGALAPEGTPVGPAGDIRAFDVVTGQERWRFHTVPRPGEPGHETWTGDSWQRRTGVNVWSSMSVDAARGLIFLPVGSPSYDFYGGDRPGQNLYGSALVALDAATGRHVWHQQLVHHDLWDFDPPARPILADVVRDGMSLPVVVQLTKMGLVFVFHRETGVPIFGIDERPVPASTLPGEQASPTQPFPRKPLPLSRHQPLTRAELSTVNAASQAECAALFDQATSVGIFTPPGRDVSLTFPGTMGGATWSGGAVDPASGYLVVNTNEIGAIANMEPSPPGSLLPFRRNGPRGAYGRFWDSQELPCQQPPWGLLQAIDLTTGDRVWQVPLGDALVLGDRGVGTGTPNLGGAMVTAGGLVFIGSSNDQRFRAFDLRSGRELWRAELPASGHAPPVSYRGARSGRQFVLIAAGGGGRFSRRISDAFVAFALPATGVSGTDGPARPSGEQASAAVSAAPHRPRGKELVR